MIMELLYICVTVDGGTAKCLRVHVWPHELPMRGIDVDSVLRATVYVVEELGC